MPHEHHFKAELNWSGSAAGPAEKYETYSREWTFHQDLREDLVGTAAVPYRGLDSMRNPEDLLLASVSACHCLSFLAAAVMAGVTVTSYSDVCEATMKIKDGKMRIVQAVLRPKITISKGDPAVVHAIHHKAHENCFIASSVNFEIVIEDETSVVPA